MPDVQLNGVRLYYESRGRGEPLVLVPGFGNGLWIWFKQVEDLSRRFRVVTFDPRGVARSEGRDEPFSISDLADDLAGLLRALRLEGAHVIGASFGGFVAQEFALAYPEMARSLVLACTSYGGPRHVRPPAETLRAIASTKGLNTEERVRENLLLAFSPGYAAREAEEVARITRLRAESPVPEYVYQRQLQAAVGFNAARRVQEIKAPTLVVTGDADVIVPPENSRNLAAAIPGAELRTVSGGSHTFFIERAAEFNRIVADFIECTKGHVQ
ncbi:MAG TPA: alpha/beta fold hydrolase [Pyrinomonadaceae bacterium]|nr:alpha/beta fold hydrolase [Pyrinomonadaceae bacterium]